MLSKLVVRGEGWKLGEGWRQAEREHNKISLHAVNQSENIMRDYIIVKADLTFKNIFLDKSYIMMFLL